MGSILMEELRGRTRSPGATGPALAHIPISRLHDTPGPWHRLLRPGTYPVWQRVAGLTIELVGAQLLGHDAPSFTPPPRHRPPHLAQHHGELRFSGQVVQLMWV